MIGLNNRVHTYARPAVKEALTEFFIHMLEAEVMPIPGTSILIFRFPDNSSYSIEFTEDALDEQGARRGVWLEVKTDDPEALKKKVLEAGLSRVEYLTGRFYFQAPGGQVWGFSPYTSPKAIDKGKEQRANTACSRPAPLRSARG